MKILKFFKFFKEQTSELMKDKLLVLDNLNNGIKVDLSSITRTFINIKIDIRGFNNKEDSRRMPSNDPFSYEKHNYKNK